MNPLPKTCSCCELGRRVLDHQPWYVCFPTGKIHTSITTERPEDCPAQLEINEGESQEDSKSD